MFNDDKIFSIRDIDVIGIITDENYNIVWN
jgi:hypothetical protein